MKPKKEQPSGVSIRCPGLAGPCPACAGLSVTVKRKEEKSG